MRKIKLFLIVALLGISGIVFATYISDYNQIKDGIILSRHLKAGTLLGAKIASGTITEGNLASSVGFTQVKVNMFLAPNTTSLQSCSSTLFVDTLSLSTGFTQSANPKNVIIYIPNAGTCTGTITVLGVNAKGAVVSDVLTVTGGDTDPVGLVSFARVTSFTGDATFNFNAGSTDTMSIGFGNKFGLTDDVYSDTCFKVIEGGSDVAPGLVTIDGTYDNVIFSNAADGVKNFVIYYEAFKSITAD